MSTEHTKLKEACAEVARTVSTRQSATESKEKFVLRIWAAVELQLMAGTP